ncbi:snake venom 5'-nucleotidase-like [Amphiura filiformis]|uniref:snake venom 5'-nucleotidase-like n=1 Tax=Amphiura filiformis TaxID=82378 RepID=UPI003B2218DF
MSKFARFLCCLVTLSCGVSCLDLTLLHTNDVHTRFEQTDLYGNECTKELEENGQCYGGVARRMTKIKEIRNSVDNVLLFDAGDAFQGTIWFYVYRGVATAHFMNLLEYDAMSIGNHEFDLGIPVTFLSNITFPALSCNIDSRNEPTMQGLYVCSYVFILPEGEKIGVVGYTLQSTPDFTQTGDLIFNPEAGSDIQQGVDDLIAMGINKIIAVGHAGIEIDKAVATSIKGIDIVIGGHTNTFLYTGTPPSNEEPYGEYPLVLSHEDDNSIVLVVSAYAYGKYLGRLDVTFDDDGVVTEYGGNPILLDKNVDEDSDTLKEITTWKIDVDKVANEVIGQAFPRLEGDFPICGTQECNMGNVLADSMVFNDLSPISTSRWSDASIGMTTAGSTRSSIEPGPITIGHLTRIMPYGNSIDKVTLKGKHLLEVLETSVASYEEGVPQGTFLQVSGLMVIYDVTRPSGDRVISVMVKCSDCDTPTYEPLEEEMVYAVLMNNYMAGGGGGYDVIKDNKLSHEPGSLDIDVTMNYLRSISYVMTGNEGRQVVYTKSNPAPCYGRAGSLQSSLSLILLFISCSAILNNFF